MVTPLWLLLLVSTVSVVAGLERQWYRVGPERNASPTMKDFEGVALDLWSFFEGDDGRGTEDEDEEYEIFFGGVLKSKLPEIMDESRFEMYARIVQSKFSWLKEIRVLDVRVYNLYSSFDFAVQKPTPYAIEVAQLDVQRQVFENKKWLNVQIGFIAAMTVLDVDANTHYRVLLNMDRANTVSVTYFSTYDGVQGITDSDRPMFEDREIDLESPPDSESVPQANNVQHAASLNVISYNIWHTMPPSWVYHDSRQRRERYSKRMEFLAERVIAENPDVVMFQEVRLDSSFRLDAEDSGSQVEHLLRFLRQAEMKAGLCVDDVEALQGCTRWNVYFQPAMSMFDRRNIRNRHEEGLAIFAIAELPLIRPGVLLLPRDLSLASDDHNRAVLGARISIPRSKFGGSGSSGSGTITTEVSVMTSHFSLDASARERAVSFLFRHTGGSPHPSILGGDLNGEPGENFMAMLTTGGGEGGWNPFQDAFDAALAKGAVSSAGSGRYWTKNGFTFPSCNPEKRIDFLLSRNASAANAVAMVESFKLIGTDHAGDSAGDDRGVVEVETDLEGDVVVEGAGGRRPDLGMLDGDSRLWASDHFGVATVFRLY